MVHWILIFALCFVSLELDLPRDRLPETELFEADEARRRVDFSLFLSLDFRFLSSFLFRLRLLLSLEVDEEDDEDELADADRLLPPLVEAEDVRPALPRQASVT